MPINTIHSWAIVMLHPHCHFAQYDLNLTLRDVCHSPVIALTFRDFDHSNCNQLIDIDHNCICSLSFM